MQPITVIDNNRSKTDVLATSVVEIEVQTVSKQIRPIQGFEAYSARPLFLLMYQNQLVPLIWIRR
jgi:hypothetical protein